MSLTERSTADRMISSSRSASKMIMTSYGRMGSYLLRTAARAAGSSDRPNHMESDARSRGLGHAHPEVHEPRRLAEPSNGPIGEDVTQPVGHLRGRRPRRGRTPH